MFGGYGPGGGFGGMAGARSRTFDEQYHCYPVSFMDRENLEDGDKILLPSSALDSLARLHVEYPMCFEISNGDHKTHCGVLEFVAPEGSCYIPFWVMQNLLLEAGGLLTVKNVALPKATFVKFQAQHPDFLDISNPKAVLEKSLRGFSCVTKGDIICISYNNRKYYLEVKEVKPANAACIIETDMNVDFDPPVGYDPDQYKKKAEAEAAGGGSQGVPLPAPVSALARKEEEEQPKFTPFAGGGVRLDGKPIGAPREPTPQPEQNGKDTPRQVVPGQAPPAPRTKSIAGKYSQRKVQMNAFTGSGNKMT